MLDKPRFAEPFGLHARYFRHGKNNAAELYGAVKCKSRGNRFGARYEPDTYRRTGFPMY